jgi:hypothetical protein
MKKPFADKWDDLVGAIFPDQVSDEIPETQLLTALHEVEHSIAIKDSGYEAAKAAWHAAPGATEYEVEMRAWQLLVDTLGEANIPMATEGSRPICETGAAEIGVFG